MPLHTNHTLNHPILTGRSGVIKGTVFSFLSSICATSSLHFFVSCLAVSFCFSTLPKSYHFLSCAFRRTDFSFASASLTRLLAILVQFSKPVFKHSSHLSLPSSLPSSFIIHIT